MDFVKQEKSKALPNIAFSLITHIKATQWLKSQSYLKDSIHESYEHWIESHSSLRSFVESNDTLWVAAIKQSEIIAIHLSMRTNGPGFCQSKVGIYDGFLIVLPSYRGLGLGKKLNEFRLKKTYLTWAWDYNWTLAKNDLVDFNLKLGYQYKKQVTEQYYLLWRLR